MAKALEFTTLDFNDPKDTLIALTFSSVDYSEPEKRKGTWSKTITLPATKRNDYFFGFAFNPDNLSDFDPKIKVPIIIDDIGFTGSLQLLSTKSLNGRTQSYSVKVFGDLVDWASKVGDKKINELNYLDSHVFTKDLMFDSWENTPQNDSYIYAPINYGGFSPNTGEANMNIEQFRPSVFCLPMIKNIYKDAGFIFIGDDFEESKHVNAVIPFTNDKINTIQKNAAVNVDNVIGNPNLPSSNFQQLADTSGSDQNPIRGIVFERKTLDIINTFSLKYNFHPGITGTYRITIEARIRYKNGVFGAGGNILNPLNQAIIATGTMESAHKTSTDNEYTSTSISTVTLENSGAELQSKVHTGSVDIDMEKGGHMFLSHRAANIGDDARLFFVSMTIELINVTTILDSVIDLKDTVPDIKQMDVLKHFISAGNFKIITDATQKTVEWVADYKFYKTEPEDWTSKVDKAKPEEVANVPPVNKLIWKYNNDTSDKHIERRIASKMAKEERLTGNEFAQGERFMASSVFSATEQTSVWGGSIVMSSEGNVVNGEFETAFSPRVVIFGGLAPLIVNVTVDGVGLFTKNTAPYLYFYDSRGADGKFSLWFDNVAATHDGLVKQNYLDTIDRIEKGKIIKMWVYLDDLDIINLDFRKPKLIGNEHYYLNKVTDYLVGSNQSTLIEFIPR